MSFKPFQTCSHKNFIKNQNSEDVNLANFPVYAVCSVNHEIMHTSHTLCWLAPKKHIACPDVSKKLTCLCIVKSKSQNFACEL